MKDFFTALFGLLLLILLAFLVYGIPKLIARNKLDLLKRKYKKTNEDFVRSCSIKKKLDKRAKYLTQLSLLGIFTIILIPFFVACCYFEWKFLPTVFIGIGYYGLFVSPLSHVLFGKDFGANALFTLVNEKIKNYLYNKNNFYPHLVPVYQRKRDELREEIISVMSEIRK
jgi:hypothetical protein